MGTKNGFGMTAARIYAVVEPDAPSILSGLDRNAGDRVRMYAARNWSYSHGE